MRNPSQRPEFPAPHLMHFEAMRLALWRESVNFLLANDTAPIPPDPVAKEKSCFP